MLFGLFGKRQDINLIPEEEQKIRTRKIQVISVLGLVLIILAQLLLFGLVTSLTFQEGRNQSRLEDNLAAKNSEWDKIATSAASLKIVKTKLAFYESFNSQHPSLPELAKKIQDNMPSGTELTNISITSNGEVSIQGEASNPAVIYQFVNTLNDKKNDFSLVKLEGVSKLTTGNYSFVLSLNLK